MLKKAVQGHQETYTLVGLAGIAAALWMLSVQVCQKGQCLNLW